MYPKLDSEPIALYIHDKSYTIPRDKLAAAFAGAQAAKEILLWESNFLTSTGESFKDRYDRAMPSCIVATNRVGLSATMETLEYHRPGKDIDYLLKEKSEHIDNPFYPFLEDD